MGAETKAHRGAMETPKQYVLVSKIKETQVVCSPKRRRYYYDTSVCTAAFGARKKNIFAP